MTNRNLKRQIRDIQVQADRLLYSKPSSVELKSFESYNNELKAYLLKNIDDNTILEYVHEIPNDVIQTNSVDVKRTFIDILVSLFAAGIASYFVEKREREMAFDAVREISGKYSSIEFLLKNYEFEEKVV